MQYCNHLGIQNSILPSAQYNTDTIHKANTQCRPILYRTICGSVRYSIFKKHIITKEIIVLVTSNPILIHLFSFFPQNIPNKYSITHATTLCIFCMKPNSAIQTITHKTTNHSLLYFNIFCEIGVII